MNTATISSHYGDCEIMSTESVRINVTGEEMSIRVLTKINQRTKFLARKAAFLEESTLHNLSVYWFRLKSYFDTLTPLVTLASHS